jgi:hypothetical protein
MNTIRSLCVSLALAAGLAGAAQAAPIPGTGGGYYGSAWYDSNQGTVIAGVATYQECMALLHSSIAHAASAWGWTVVTYNPCRYRPPFGQMAYEQAEVEKVGIHIGAGSPGESVEVVRMIGDEILRTRDQYRADDYDNALDAIYTAAGKR